MGLILDSLVGGTIKISKCLNSHLFIFSAVEKNDLDFQKTLHFEE